MVKGFLLTQQISSITKFLLKICYSEIMETYPKAKALAYKLQVQLNSLKVKYTESKTEVENTLTSQMMTQIRGVRSLYTSQVAH